jgi:hypothetical protein
MSGMAGIRLAEPAEATGSGESAGLTAAGMAPGSWLVSPTAAHRVP